MFRMLATKYFNKWNYHSNRHEFFWEHMEYTVFYNKYKFDKKSNEEMRQSAMNSGVSLVLAALKACAALRDLQTGTRVHTHANENGVISNTNVSNSLVHMYAKCGSLQEACELFENMEQHSVVSWNTIMFGLVENGDACMALRMFYRMQEEGFLPNALTYVAALKSCANAADRDIESNTKEWLEKGREIHTQASRSKIKSTMMLDNALVNMYAKCGGILEGSRVFDGMSFRDTVSYNSLMFGHVEDGDPEQALELFKRMQEDGVEPNALSFVAALKACAVCGEGDAQETWLRKGREIHSQAAKAGHDKDVKVASTLVDMYAKCGSLEESVEVFQGMNFHDVVSWNSIIMGYAQCGEGEAALRMFSKMQEEGFRPNPRTIVAALQACGDLAGKQEHLKRWCLEKGREIHLQVTESDIFVANKLVDMYTKCGSISEAWFFFEQMPAHDLISFNVMLFGFAENGDGDSGLELFSRMQGLGIDPTPQTFVAALKACACCATREEGSLIDGKLVKAVSLDKGCALHTQVDKAGCEGEMKVASILVDMYSKCACIEKASAVFHGMKNHDVVAWNAMIAGYAQAGNGGMALHMFGLMQLDGVLPDELAFIAALKATSCLKNGFEIHIELKNFGYEQDRKVANTLLDMYVRCGSMLDASTLFERISRDTVSWNAMIMGYSLSGEGEVALKFFTSMLEEGVIPNDVSLVSVLKACGSLGALNTGKMVYAEFREAGLAQHSVTVSNSLIGFYGKCGSMNEATAVFDSMEIKQVVTWNALIAGYAHQGETEEVFRVFDTMRKEQLPVDEVTFLSILNACSHTGLVEKGKEYFELMKNTYRVVPRVEHYTCMVDLLGRANLLDEAVEMAETMPYEANLTMWRTVLGASRKWKNIRIARLAFKKVMKIDERDSAAYVLMANTYASVGMYEDSLRFHNMRTSSGVWKKAGKSWWSDEYGVVHTFVSGDSTHPQNEEIRVRLGSLFEKMKMAGYVPDLSNVLRDVPDEDKEMALCGHSERLAIGCALVNSVPGTTVRIVKNLRVCDDCHVATKVISKVEERVIVCRDANRFHVFKNGECSCGDFW